MKHLQAPLQSGNHKPGCRCPYCLSEFERRHCAAQQFYALLQMSWVGIRAAVAYAEFARKGIEEAFPYRARVALATLRREDARLLDNLLTEILD